MPLTVLETCAWCRFFIVLWDTGSRTCSTLAVGVLPIQISGAQPYWKTHTAPDLCKSGSDLR
jgi:hypothetical protein